MNVWYHLPTIFNWRRALQIAGLITLCVALITTLFLSSTTRAAPGVNQALSFQGRLLNSSGGAVADGYYNMQFKIYQDGTGTAAGNPGGSLEWTETHINDGGTDGIQVKNGYFSVNLGTVNPFGSSVDWNQDTLWLSMNVAGSATDCTTYNSGTCVADGEMLPMKRLTAVPYAMQAENANKLGGLAASGFIQNTTSAQTADFNVTGSGRANTLQGNSKVIAPLFDTTTNLGALNIGTVDAGSINIGTANFEQTLSIGTGSGNKAVTLGSTHGTSYTLIQGGSNGVRVIAGGGFAVQTPATGFDNLLVTNTGGIMVRLGNSEGFTIRNDADNGIFYVSSSLNRVGVNYSSNFLVQGTANFEQGITVTGGSTLTYQTPGGYNMSTAINIPNYTVGAYGSVLAMGLPSTSAATARGILVSDGRTVAHQATIGILSHDESSVFGLSYNGTNTGTLSNMGNSVALQGNGLNLLTATNNGGAANVGIGNDASAGYALDVTGAIRATTALYTPAVDTASAGALTIGGTNATSINLAQNVTVAAGKSLTIAGGDTASRPASPTEGMVYFDTTTKQLLTYANGKWQSDAKTSTKIVAAGNSSQAAKDGADFVANGEASVGTGTVDGDQVQINAAIAALPASGGSIYLTEGTFVLDGTIVLPSNVKLSGAGDATIVTVNNSLGAGITFVTNSDTTNGNNNITIRDIKFDGNRANNGANVMVGLSFTRVGSGTGSSALPGVTITNTTFNAIRGDMLLLSIASNNRITNNAFINSASEALEIATGSNNIISGNSFNGVDTAIMLSAATYNTVSDNTIEASTSISGALNVNTGANYNNISGNTFRNNATAVSLRIATSNHNTVSTNLFTDNGGSAAISALSIVGNADNNIVNGNTFRDTAGTGYAIDITASNGDTNMISNNSLSGTGASTINDLGTGTIYSNQLDSTGKLINKSAAGSTVQTSTNNATAFTVQNASNVSALTVDTTTNSVLVAGSLDTTAAAGMTIGSANATSITIGKTTSNIAATVLGTAVFKPTTGNDSTTSFQLQRADGTKMFVADSSGQTITFGDPASANRTVISTATGQITKFGTARNTKKIILSAEYLNSVLDAGSGSDNAGTMTSSVDLTNRMNYYKWTTSQATNQNYDVVVQIPIPTDFDGWSGSNPLSISTYTSNTTNGTVTLEARDSSNGVQCNFVSVTPGSTGTWAANNSACTLSSGTYTAGDYMTLRVRMQSPTGGDVRIGNINLSYLSKY